MKKILFFVLLIGIIFVVSPCLAAKPVVTPNLIGTWTGTANMVAPPPEILFDLPFEINIYEQQGNLFRATITAGIPYYLGGDHNDLYGVIISANEIKMTGYYCSFSAKYDSGKLRLDGYWQNILFVDGYMPNSGTFILYKQ